jgi:hypothetical protein
MAEDGPLCPLSADGLAQLMAQTNGRMLQANLFLASAQSGLLLAAGIRVDLSDKLTNSLFAAAHMRSFP